MLCAVVLVLFDKQDELGSCQLCIIRSIKVTSLLVLQHRNAIMVLFVSFCKTLTVRLQK